MKCPDIYAIYLPQFHETEHNNEWWGKGYTEWSAVREAKSLFEGHNQPRIPLDHHYYNLLERKEIQWQANLAKEYGINGFIFYHYYFGNGEMELEKPAEILLECTEIDMPFCFSWANQSWIRTWSKWTGNSWTPQYDNNRVGDEDEGILVKQKYGNEDEWKQHFEYLLPFFMDSRYIRINDSPLFFFYAPDSIDCLKEMIIYWRKLAKESGLKDIYFVGQRTWYNDRGLDAIMIDYTLSEYKKKKPDAIEYKKNLCCIDYDDYWKTTLELSPVGTNRTYYEGRCGYDNTPRYGDYGDILIGQDAKKFGLYFEELIKKTIYYKNEFLVIDAWNEWGEGMYLEPDEDNGFNYLLAVKESRMQIERLQDGIERNCCYYKSGENNQTVERNTKKYHYFYQVCSLWVDLLQREAVLFAPYFKKNNINSVAIYGIADLGKKLLRQLLSEEISVMYIVDQSGGKLGDEIMSYRPSDSLPEVDLMIVTAFDSGSIVERMGKKINGMARDLLSILRDIENANR